MLERDSRTWPDRVPMPAAARDRLGTAVAAADRALAPHDPQVFEDAMMQLAVVFPNNRAAAAELEARLRAYALALADLPGDLLVLAVARAVRDCVRFPKPAELRGFVSGEVGDRRRRQARLRMLCERAVGLA